MGLSGFNFSAFVLTGFYIGFSGFLMIYIGLIVCFLLHTPEWETLSFVLVILPQKKHRKMVKQGE